MCVCCHDCDLQARQLISSGVLPVTEYPTFDADSGMGVLGSFEETEEDLEIEVNTYTHTCEVAHSTHLAPHECKLHEYAMEVPLYTLAKLPKRFGPHWPNKHNLTCEVAHTSYSTIANLHAAQALWSMLARQTEHTVHGGRASFTACMSVWIMTHVMARCCRASMPKLQQEALPVTASSYQCLVNQALTAMRSVGQNEDPR